MCEMIARARGILLPGRPATCDDWINTFLIWYLDSRRTPTMKKGLVYWIAQCDSTEIHMQVSKPQVGKKFFTAVEQMDGVERGRVERGEQEEAVGRI